MKRLLLIFVVIIGFNNVASAQGWTSSQWGSPSNQPWNTPTDVAKFAKNQQEMAVQQGLAAINNGTVVVQQNAPVQTNSNQSSSSSTQVQNSSSSRKKDCHLCYGTGQCRSCNGSGFIYSFYGDKLDCPNCVNGKCRNCQ